MSVRRPRDSNEDGDEENRPSKILKADEVAPASPSTESRLAALLDITNVEPKDMPEAFDKIASELMHNHRLKVKNKDKITSYEILEAEFYLVHQGGHADPYTHGEEEQKVSGRWYFHRVPRWSPQNEGSGSSGPTGYRSGSRKGVDLTFGNPVLPPDSQPGSSSASYDIRGGILLRTLRNENGGAVTCGPSLLVDEILRSSSAVDIPDLVTSKWGNDSSAFFDPSSETDGTPRQTRLYLEYTKVTDVNKLSKLHTSPRIGLDLGNSFKRDARIAFLDRPYRYFSNAKLFKDKGRAQTFVGVFRKLKVGANPPYTKILWRLEQYSGIPQNLIKKYLAAYQKGWDGKDGQGVTSMLDYTDKGPSPERLIMIMGALERYKAPKSVQPTKATSSRS